jgi:hypothetical protein
MVLWHRQFFQIVNLVVKAVFVLVVNFVALWDRAVIKFPYRPV